MSLHRWFAALIAVATLTSPAFGQAKIDTVSLRFGWPVGMKARVDQEWTRVQVGSRRTDSVTVKSRYRLTVSAHPKGRLVQPDSFAVTSMPAGAAKRGPGDVDPQQVFARLGSIQPSYVVNTDGDFIAVEGVERTKQVLDSMFAPLIREMAGAPAEIKAMMQSATSVQTLTAAAAQEWNVLVGTWVGADWEVGEVYEAESEEPSPIMPALKIPMRHEFSAAERVPCVEGETTRRCIRLEMISEPDSVALRKVMTDLMTKLAPKDASVLAAFKGMRVANELTVITDPRDLRPYGMSLVKTVEVEGSGGPNEPVARTRRVDVRTARYTYER